MTELFIKIPHYSKLSERKEIMEKEYTKLKNNNNDVTYNIEIYEDYNKEDINNDIIKKYFDSNLREWNKRIIISEQKKTSFKRKITIGEKSLIMKSINLWKNIIDNNIDFCLIVEDDVHYVEDFTKKYLDCLKNIPDDWDIFYVNLEYIDKNEKKRNFRNKKDKLLYNSRKSIKENNSKQLEENKKLNPKKSNDYFTLITQGPKWHAGYGYVIKNSTAKLFYDTLIRKKCALPIDAEIGYLIQKHKLNSYFLNFNLVYHNFIVDSSLAHERYLARKGKLV